MEKEKSTSGLPIMSIKISGIPLPIYLAFTAVTA
ncbi:MAG: hypothetical protein K0R23_2180, partial [Lacrimispora sp.]|nr:hypothetical protein [Lacrimispora sp.]